MARSAAFTTFPERRPDPTRIAAFTAAITANLVLLAFLVQPPSASLAGDESDTRPPPIIIIPKVEELPILKDPPPPKQPDPPQLRTIRKDPVVQPPPQDTPLTDKTSPMDVPQQPFKGIIPDKVDIKPPGPVEASLTPIASPAPNYPIDAIRDGVTGTVQLELLVGADGRVLDAKIVRGSGDRRLDNAAREQVLRNWRFRPATVNGVPVLARGLVPIVFNLNGQ